MLKIGKQIYFLLPLFLRNKKYANASIKICLFLKYFHMKKSLFFSILLAFSGFNAAKAQEMKMSHICGTHDQDALTDRIKFNRELEAKGLLADENRGAKKYVPVKFNIIAKADKSGRISESKILENLAQMNKDYADQDIVFYLAKFPNGEFFNYMDNDNAYTNQSNTFGEAALQVQFSKNKNAINFYLAKETPSPGSQLDGTTLGYFSPSKDWLVIKNDQVNSTSGTISHEVGHFFSLPHPFKGWDQQPCKEVYKTQWASGAEFKITNPIAPDGFSLVENADGSNCKTAADLFCDTPADYNLGFGWDGCNPFTKKIKGPGTNDTYVNPEEKLFMGYFIGCADYIFSTEQKAAVLKDYLSPKRAYIRPAAYTPTTDVVNVAANLIYPIQSQQVAFDKVDFDWSDVPGATRYILEIDVLPTFGGSPIRIVTSTSSASVTTLLPKKNYNWRVMPFNENGSVLELSTLSKEKFTTTQYGVNTHDLSSVAVWSVAPNPVSNGSALFVDVEVAKPFKAHLSLVNAIGQTMQTFENQELNQGGNRIEFSTQNLPAGIYSVLMIAEGKTMNKKVVVIK